MSSKPIVALVLPHETAAQMFSQQDLLRLSQEAQVRGPLPPDQAQDALAEAVVAITGWGSTAFDAAVLDRAPRLRLIAHSAGSVRDLVTDALYDRGVKITNAASANAVPVAQYTVAMMVCLLKQVPWLAGAMARNDQAEIARRAAQVRDMHDICVGLVGASRIGREVIRLLKSYPAVRIKLYDPYLKPAQAAEIGAELSSLEEVCRCEVVSVHAPNLPETRHMISAKMFDQMPDHAVFINTSRGALVDEAALVARVKGRPLYVLLDVTDPEPPEPDSPLRTHPNILLTPHVAGAMRQARKEMGRTAIEETLRFLRGEPLRHEVTREMMATQA